MTTITWTRRGAAGAALALLAAGCGSSSPHQTTTPPKSGGPAAAAFAYSRCMRNHGFTGFPDPQVSTSANGTSIRIAAVGPNAGTPQQKAAAKACRGLLPQPGNVISPAQQEARARDLLAFARCLRDHGVANFPDPTSQGQLTMQMIQAAGVDLHAPAVLPAARACVGLTDGQITMAGVQQAIDSGS
jgi:hypothetical protein